MRIGVVTMGRSDYGFFVPILKQIRSEEGLDFHLMVSGAHLSPWFGKTVESIEQDGFEIGDYIETLLSSDSAEGIGKSIGLGTIGFAQAYIKCRPDILLVLGDRFDMHAAVVAAVAFKIPVAHVAGGESTEGVIDDVFRHSITKMSHLHFVSTEEYRNRVIQMGEEPWRVIVSGAPSLDMLQDIDLLSKDQLERDFNLKLEKPFILITYHPVTLESDYTEQHFSELLAALEQMDMGLIFTSPNSDTDNYKITDMINQFSQSCSRVQGPVNFGSRAYFSAMQYASAMIGNSSSGIVEAASMKLPVVNVGNRQSGRYHALNVIDVGNNSDAILNSLQRAISQEFRVGLDNLVNPYGDGHAAVRIVETLKGTTLGDSLVNKHFHKLG